tara:strand:- start:61 stop:627 length:567 start_codon:yes stop_codon:yes gene_type:complete
MPLVGLSVGHSAHRDNPETQQYEYSRCKASIELAGELLSRSGVDVYLIEPGTYDLSNDDALISKVAQINTAECDCAIELHLNAGGGNYSRAYYWGSGSSSSVEGLLLARRIHLNKMVVNPSRSMPPQKQSDIPRSLYFLNNTHMPSVIYEPAFMDHSEHRDYIESNRFTPDTAITIYRAVREYLEERA